MQPTRICIGIDVSDRSNSTLLENIAISSQPNHQRCFDSVTWLCARICVHLNLLCLQLRLHGALKQKVSMLFLLLLPFPTSTFPISSYRGGRLFSIYLPFPLHIHSTFPSFSIYLMAETFIAYEIRI